MRDRDHGIEPELGVHVCEACGSFDTEIHPDPSTKNSVKHQDYLWCNACGQSKKLTEETSNG